VALSIKATPLTPKLGFLHGFLCVYFFFFSLFFFPYLFLPSFLKLSQTGPGFMHSEWKKCVKRWFDAPLEFPNIQRLGFFYLI
jgi:hypothetical protein